METRRLQVLLELSRLGSMRNVADELGTTTSTVSQQIAKLAQETGTALIEPDGRRVRLTPAGRRLADHARVILGAVDAARLDLDPDAEPAGTVRVSGFATAIRRALLPVVADLARTHPGVEVVVYEYEPAEGWAGLANDTIDLALTYDYNLAPAGAEPSLETVPLWSQAWCLGVPASGRDGGDSVPASGVPAGAGKGGQSAGIGDTLAVFDRFRHHHWIGNSRNRADEIALRTLASMAGFQPHLAHEADSLELVEDLILSGMGVGLLPADRPPRPGVALIPLTGPEVQLRAYAQLRLGRRIWPPLGLVLDRVIAQAGTGA